MTLAWRRAGRRRAARRREARRRALRRTGRRIAVVGGTALLAWWLITRYAGDDDDAVAPAAAATLDPEDIVVAGLGTIETGPMLAGSLEPRRQATLRAEVAGSVLATYAEVGNIVMQGTLLARIEDPAIAEEYGSALAAVASAEEALGLARRNAARAEALLGVGGIARRAAEEARANVAAAEAQLADARARLAASEEQRSDARVRSPIDGTVRRRDVSAGDVVQIGAPLFTITDRSSMRLEAAVPAEHLTLLYVGAPVEFTVHGYPGRVFRGEVQHLSPAADSATRQVHVLASIPNPGLLLVAGLYAEGRITSATEYGLVVPLTAVDLTRTPTVSRVRGGKVEHVTVVIGARDARDELVEITAGIQAGDTLLVGPARALSPGTAVAVAPTRPGAAPPAAAPRPPAPRP